MFVRWIGAFRKHEGGVLDSISFEMGREDPAACERITRNSRTEVFARVGLAVKPDHVYRNFQSDVWSVYTEEGQLKIPVRIIMDDFASGALVPDFDKIISVVRSRDIWLTLCIQSLSQLESLYDHTQAKTIINNCDHIVFLGSNDLESAEFIGTRAGKTPEMILAMDRSKEYFIEGDKMAVLREKTPSYTYEEEPV
jgi:hypothetical protein